MPAGGPVGKPDDTFESFFEYDSVRGSTENSSGSPAVREGLAGDRTHDLLDGVLERTSKVTGCFCLEEFRFVQTTVKHASLWIAVQGLLVLLLLLLYVYTLEPHINQVQSTLEKYCSDGHKWSEEAVCLGPSWKETLSATLLMHGQSREQSTQDWVITHDEVLEFDVASSPPTILVGVRPLGRCKGGVRWRLLIFDVARKFEETHTGAGSQSFVVSTTRAAASKWKVEFSLLKGVDQLGESEMCEIEIFAVDNQQPHLPRIHDKFSDSNGQCEFAGTWLRLADRHDLGWAQFAVSGINNFLWLSVLLVGVVSFLVYTRGVSNSLAKVDYFSAAVLVKSFIIDISMQVLLVSYIYYWYGRNGLQCQMCLFHSNHCENFDADPMHGTLRYIIIVVTVSALMPQLLIRQKAFTRNARYVGADDELDHHCMGGFTRIGLASLLLLPFTTGFLILGPLIFIRGSGVTGGLYMLLAIPVVCGWSLLLCIPTLAICDDIDDYDYAPILINHNVAYDRHSLRYVP
ncbi:hypothetical protein FOL46_007573 [Perkinsus olseni]|uniref:Transmembrane protein n=1 Tax=Perkinsus olseni TaxID=32597 RepID=A0A7J6LCY6_PEROL|nr:hypothetical protein FOL46_007573 [Perkinsus olseni]